MKKLLSIILAALICFGGITTGALAIEEKEERVVIGADLNEKQIAGIYKTFGLEQGRVKELKVTNAEEREYFEDVLPDERLGRVALSCVYIRMLDEGEGLSISTSNINWCTEEMYANALATAGITDAEVIITAPYPLSGTAALTGIYKAYEDITGESLDPDSKDIAAEELITTGELADIIGSEEATRIINELKKILDNIKTMSDDEVRAEIIRIADMYNVRLTDSQVEQLLRLCRNLQNLNVDGIQERMLSWLRTAEDAERSSKTFAAVWKKVREFFQGIIDFIGGLFGGN